MLNKIKNLEYEDTKFKTNQKIWSRFFLSSVVGTQEDNSTRRMD